MKMIACLLAAAVFAPSSYAQRGNPNAGNVTRYCRARVDLDFNRLDHAMIDAVIAKLPAIQKEMPHVQVGLGFPKSGHNIKWILTYAEIAHGTSLMTGESMSVTLQALDRDENARSKVLAMHFQQGQSYVELVGRAFKMNSVLRDIEAKAKAQNCPLVPQAMVERAPSSEDFTSIRVMTANISSGNGQSYDNGEGLRIMKGLKPDVVMIQEFNYKSNSPEDLMEMILAGFRKGFHYFRESEATDQIPNGIITHFPIRASGEWTDRGMPNRDFAWAQLDIPGVRDFWAISVHLHSSKVPVRKQEAEDLVRLVKENIPEKDYVVLGGDFNITGRSDEIIKIFSEVLFETAPPTNSKGTTTTNMTNKKNYDWVLNDHDLAKYQVPTQFKAFEEEAEVELENTFPNGLVFDSTTFPRLALVEPILKEDSRASGMQHLAVIKDYRVPGAEPAAPIDEPVFDIDCR